MPKKILLIENDSAFAEGLTQALELTGFEVRVTGDGKEGLELARDWEPAAIVLCVELPGMSGYLVCQKLRKDDALKAIPLVLASAEATADTFEKHKALKVRADEYLLKPYDPPALVEKLGALVGLPEGAPLVDAGEEELVSLEEEMGLEALPPEPEGELPAFDLQALPEEPAAAGDDETLALLDDAFAGLTAPPPAAAGADESLDLDLDRPVAAAELDAASASLPDEPLGAPPALGLDEADAALGALAADEPLGADDPEPEPPARAPIRGASADLLRAAGIKLLDDEPLAPPPPRAAPAPAPAGDRVTDRAAAATLDRLERQLAETRQELADARVALTARDAELAKLRSRLELAEADAGSRDAELAATRSKAEAAAAQARKAELELERSRKAEAELRTAREAATRMEAQLREAEAKAAEAERRADEAEGRAEDAASEARQKADELTLAQEQIARAEALEREVDDLKTELVVARGEAEGARGEVEKHTADLKKRVQELEASNAKNEERVLKAYQKIKNDEKVREKVRKAVAIAAQLLDEGLPPAAEPAPQAEKPTAGARVAAAAAALMGRD